MGREGRCPPRYCCLLLLADPRSDFKSYLSPTSSSFKCDSVNLIKGEITSINHSLFSCILDTTNYFPVAGQLIRPSGSTNSTVGMHQVGVLNIRRMVKTQETLLYIEDRSHNTALKASRLQQRAMGFQPIMCHSACTYPKLLSVGGLEAQFWWLWVLRIVWRLWHLWHQPGAGKLSSATRIFNYQLLLEILFWEDSPWSSWQTLGLHGPVIDIPQT